MGNRSTTKRNKTIPKSPIKGSNRGDSFEAVEKSEKRKLVSTSV